jgi:CheY-like chemotaxis protein
MTLMGGEIGLESAPGSGSTFWIELPLGKQAAAPMRPSPEPPSLEGARVLIVDDNATNREILRHQLAAWRLRTTSVASGADALDALRREAAAGDAYQLAILDMQMPEMDGMAVARAIKGDALLKATRVVVLTSLAYHPEESELGRLGVAAYMAKPVKQSKLFDSLVMAMRDRQDGASSGPRAARADVEPTLANLPTRGVRVLLAEDNTVNQRVALRQLSKLGITADPVGNGLEALAAITQAPYLIILMDCQMPEMDGYEATRRIRQMEKDNPDEPRHFVIALTAHALDGDRQRCLDAGMDDYVTKPIRLDELARVLERCLPAVVDAARATSTAIA